MKRLALLILIFMSAPALAQAETIEDVVIWILGKGYLPNLRIAMESIAYVCGVGFGVKAVFALKDSTEKKEGLRKPIVWLACASMLLSLPQMLIIGQKSLGLKPDPETVVNKSKY